MKDLIKKINKKSYIFNYVFAIVKILIGLFKRFLAISSLLTFGDWT